MARIFFALSVVSVTLLLITIGLGFWVDDVYGKSVAFQETQKKVRERERDTRNAAPDEELEQLNQELEVAGDALYKANRQKMIHFSFGVLTTLVVVLVNCVSVTYFIGTQRWCREVVETYRLDDDLLEQSTALKRTAFPWALLGIVTVLFIAAFGASSDPAANYETAGDWMPLHRIVAIMGTIAIAWAYLVQVGKVGANYELILEILGKADRIREAARARALAESQSAEQVSEGEPQAETEEQPSGNQADVQEKA